MSRWIDSFNHVVVLMLENRSFDNLLGNLYQNGVPKGQHFEGLQNAKDYANPIPSRAKNPDHKADVPVGKAKDYHQPFPDPGEEYPHINTQLYDVIDPANVGKTAWNMTTPYNVPSDPPPQAGMKGFVNDYVNTLQAMTGTPFADPDYDIYSQIMACFEPAQLPVLSTLAKSFAVFDHWHCSVPSQTWCNRAFWHAATSGGQVFNPIGDAGEGDERTLEEIKIWASQVWSKETVFHQMKQRGIKHKVYTDNYDISLTYIVHGMEDLPHSLSRFHHDLQHGELPDYAFIEPRFLSADHNDQHPSSQKTEGQAGTVLLGEHLIADIYNAIKNSSYRDDVLFIITHDEHGGCFDHVAPPAAVPPASNQKGQDDFTFNRLGIRVPMVMISSRILENSIINTPCDHTSFLATLSDKWGLPALTNRAASAFSIADVMQKRMTSSLRTWPDVHPVPIPESHANIDLSGHPLNGLQRSILTGAVALHFKDQLESDDFKEWINRAILINTVDDALNFIKDLKCLNHETVDA
ncbi:MAG: alkaline phosphatase family protein [Sphingomonadales bacterium]|jgi:phospholipase C